MRKIFLLVFLFLLGCQDKNSTKLMREFKKEFPKKENRKFSVTLQDRSYRIIGPEGTSFGQEYEVWEVKEKSIIKRRLMPSVYYENKGIKAGQIGENLAGVLVEMEPPVLVVRKSLFNNHVDKVWFCLIN